jgi:hypothetical protein
VYTVKQERTYGIIRTREEAHTTSMSPHKTPSIACLLVYDYNFIACLHIQFPEISIARKREQYSCPTSVDGLLEMVFVFVFVA